MKPTKKFILVLLLIPLVLVLSSYINFKNLQISNTGNATFTEKLIKTIQTQEKFYMTDVTPFTWDNMYVFPPYTSKTEMHSKTGIKWTTSKSYIGYLLEKTFLGEYPLDDDSVQKLIFIRDNKVVCDCTLFRKYGDFTSLKNIIKPGDDLFYVNKSENQILILNTKEK